jgi:hypothetical protein
MDKLNVFDLTPREKINPYLSAAALVAKRFVWDINPKSWGSRKKTKRWKNLYSGQKAIILCNGPSLNKVNFDKLKKTKIFTFGLNKINLLFDKTDFRPSCVVSVNPLVIEQNKEFYNKTNLPLFLDTSGLKCINYRDNICFLHSAGVAGRFARDCSVSINQGNTVTYVALQLAFHMGFTSVALVGCDHYFKTKGPSNKKVRAGVSDPNHFDPRYFSNGDTWQLPDLIASDLHYEKARDIFTHFGREIVNCTEGGALEIFKRISLDEFLEY